MISLFAQVASALGATLVLGAYVALQLRRLDRDDPWFNIANALGSFLLGICAVIDLRWGFIVLETVWTVVSLIALVRAHNRRRNP